MNRREFIVNAMRASIAMQGLMTVSLSHAAMKTDRDEFVLQAMKVTNGDIAVINHLSTLERMWRVYDQQPFQPDIVESIIQGELINVQFLGDYIALDRLLGLSENILQNHPVTAKSYIMAAQIAASRHHFEQAKDLLSKASQLSPNQKDCLHLELSIRQAVTSNDDELVLYRKNLAQTEPNVQNLVAYSALMADRGEMDVADAGYRRALDQYNDLSPFVPAWICFQLGILWNEIAKTPDRTHAAGWYLKALEYLPRYTAARVHLTEIFLDQGNLNEAIQILSPAIASTAPEVSWRLSEIYVAKQQPDLGLAYLNLADSMFNDYLSRHRLAFADHAAEFYASSGKDIEKAFDLALSNYNNRPTDQALSLLQSIKNIN